MSKEQKIEEITKIIEDEYDSAEMTGSELHCYEVAELIYEAGYHKQDWISVEERLPPEGSTVLICTSLHSIAIWHYVEAGIWVTGHEYEITTHEGGVTHWMPLPEAPKMKGGEE